MNKKKETTGKEITLNKVTPRAIIKTADEFSRKTDEYFALCKTDKKAPSIAGFTIFLGYKNRGSLNDLAKRGPEYETALSYAKLKIEEFLVDKLLKPGQPTAGAIFALKNLGGGDGWKDKPDEGGFGGGYIKFVYESNIDREDDAS